MDGCQQAPGDKEGEKCLNEEWNPVLVLKQSRDILEKSGTV